MLIGVYGAGGKKTYFLENKYENATLGQPMMYILQLKRV
jgi:hypothetical protein